MLDPGNAANLRTNKESVSQQKSETDSYFS